MDIPAWGAEKQELSRQRAASKPVKETRLPPWSDQVRGVPNTILRSALFAAIKRGKRYYMERESIASFGEVEIRYSGQQLNQADLDVWQGTLHIARHQPLGNQIEFTEKSFLRMIGRGGESGKNIGKSDREWLRKTFARLSSNTIEIKDGHCVYGGSLIDEYFRNESNGRYVIILNPRMKVLFKHDGWTQIDWHIRWLLRSNPLAQWLHVFYSSHADPYPMKVETLHKRCGSATGAKAKTMAAKNKAILGWRDDSLIPALTLLANVYEQIGQTFSWELNNDLVHINRVPSNTQKKHLQKKVQFASKSNNAGGYRTRTQGG